MLIFFKKNITFFKFFLVGSITFAIEFILFIVFSNLIYYKFANLIAIGIGILLNYILSSKFVFKKSNRRKGTIEIFYFFLVSISSISISHYSLILFFEKLTISIEISKILSVIMSTFFNFIFKLNFVFKKN
jgi:hypothetical protein